MISSVILDKIIMVLKRRIEDKALRLWWLLLEREIGRSVVEVS